jgi:hypothetical protein
MQPSRLISVMVVPLATALASCFRAALLTLGLAVAVQNVNATGFYGPQVYLDEGGKNLLQSPEFYWDVELKRLAGNFKPAEKRISIRDKEGNELAPGEMATKEVMDEAGAGMTADADNQDFADALKTGRLKPTDPAKATAQQQAARNFIATADNKTTEPLPKEFPSEFADYHKAAFDYKLGQWDEAITAWETLLKRLFRLGSTSRLSSLWFDLQTVMYSRSIQCQLRKKLSIRFC